MITSGYGSGGSTGPARLQDVYPTMSMETMRCRALPEESRTPMQSHRKTLLLDLLLHAAKEDEALLARLGRSKAPECIAALTKIKASEGPAAPDESTDVVLDLLENYGRTIATFTAEQDRGEYEIQIEGFSRLCVVVAPEYGTTGPFGSHDDAASYVRWSWGEFLKNEVWLTTSATATAGQQTPSPTGSDPVIPMKTSNSSQPLERGSPEYKAWLAQEVASLNKELDASVYTAEELAQLRTTPLQATFVPAASKSGRSGK